MSLQSRDKRALTLLAAALGLWLALQALLPGDDAPEVVASADSIPAFERRLIKLRQLAASVPGKEKVLEQVSKELAEREKGVIQADTPQQAQAHLFEVLRDTARKQAPPLDLRNFENGQIRPFGEKYGEALVSVSFECEYHNVLNLLADLTGEAELISVNELRISAANEKAKTVTVRLTASGIVPRRLVPQRKGLGSF